MQTLRNQVQLIGRLGQDVNTIKTETGKSLARLSVATNSYYKDAEGKSVENTEWHRVVAWGKTAELMGELLTKGQEVLIQGRISTRKYETKAGEVQYTTEVVAEQFLKLSKSLAVADM
ncbi:MAG: single-stranded DNA-binding protein [Saprospiraceae bacterium]|nr:single-stranded DNA-binding protein [Saprospiraceae bacterium]